MITYPIIKRDNDSIEVLVSPCDDDYPKHLHIEFVLDFNQFHDVIGIEILDLNAKAGKRCLEVVENVIDVTGEGLSYSYDKGTDSFYLEITKEHSLDQEAVDGILIINKEGHIIGFIVGSYS